MRVIGLAVVLALSLFAVPLVAETQQAEKVWRIGYLGYTYPSQARDLDVFRERLRDLGYVERKNLVIESRSAESSFERLPALAAELVTTPRSPPSWADIAARVGLYASMVARATGKNVTAVLMQL
jgi:hypothetical protein